jgi:serine-protein kinase ATM
LPLILSLVNSYADSPSQSQEEPRVAGAKTLWKKLKRNPRISAIMLEMESMSLALIDLANRESDKITSKVASLLNLSNAQCPTIEIPVMRDCNYKGLVTSVVRWKSAIENVGGINAPKKITCLCSDGEARPQLLKGKDDMRQDAVMEQVFGVVNQLLRSNKETRKRHARMRTYKVVPFSRVSFLTELGKGQESKHL